MPTKKELEQEIERLKEIISDQKEDIRGLEKNLDTANYDIDVLKDKIRELSGPGH